MATTAPVNAGRGVPKGVQPLRAGQGNSFFWRRLHSLTGIVPIGLFVIEHFLSNLIATGGPQAYIKQVKLLTGLPFAFWLEVFGIYLPLLYHALYGIYIWWRGDNNVNDYPWVGNWGYTLQRYSGILAFAYIAYHVYYMRFSGVHLFAHPDAAFWKVQNEISHPAIFAFYVVGIVSASWHFGYGLFLFCAKWGIVTGKRARTYAQRLGVAVGLLFVVIGIVSAIAFVRPNPKWPKQEFKPEWSQPNPAEQPSAGESSMLR